MAGGDGVRAPLEGGRGRRHRSKQRMGRDVVSLLNGADFARGVPLRARPARRVPQPPAKGALRDHALWAISEREAQANGWWLDMPQAKSRCAPVTALQAAVA